MSTTTKTVNLAIPDTAEERTRKNSYLDKAIEAERMACEAIARKFEKEAWGAPKATATLIAEEIAARKLRSMT